MNEVQTKTSFMNDENLARLLSKVTVCPKVGVISDGKETYIALFKRPGSTKPTAVVSLPSVVMLLEDYFENVLPIVESKAKP